MLGPKGGRVTWNGKMRAPLFDQDVYMVNSSRGRFRSWLGVGGNPESVVRAARPHGFGLMLAIIGGPPGRFAPFSEALPPGPRDVRTTRPGRWACTRPDTSPPPTSRPAKSSGRTTSRSFVA